MNLDPYTLIHKKEYFDRAADYITYWRAWEVWNVADSRMDAKSQQFIDDITSNPPKSFSDRQREWVNDLFERWELL